jgi:putative DNA primase/helicase
MKCPPGLLMARKYEAHPTELADLFGKRLVVAIETEEGHRLNETRIKELTGGDRIPARRMREDYWYFDPTHTLVMATNHKPVIRGTDHAIWRRLKLVPFTVKVDDDRADKAMPEKLRADKAMPEKLRAEYPGILAWCVRGCRKWQAGGLGEPEEVAAATAGYRKDQDILGAFLEEHALFGPPYRVRAKDIYGRYEQWAKDGHEYAMTLSAFGRAMEERGIEKTTSNGVWYVGVALRQVPTSGMVEGEI